MKNKIGIIIFIVTLIASIMYFAITSQEVKTIIYSDGPYVMSVADSICKTIEINPVDNGSSLPDISVKYNTIKINEMINDILKFPININNKNSQIHSTFSKIDSVFSVGDIHGEYQTLLTLLKNNQIITKNQNWNFGNGHLVFCGDIFDRGDKVTETLWFIYNLEQQAKKNGGKVHFLLGNHEIMTLKGDHRYLHKKYTFIQNKLGIKYSFLYNKNTVLGKWIRRKNSVIKINDILYVHGGLHPDIVKLGLNLSEINQLIRYYLNDEGFNNSIRFLINQKGPLWYRGYLKANENYSLITSNEIDKILNYFNAEKIVFAHTTVRSIKSLHQSKLIAIDVPMSIENSEGLFMNFNNIYTVNIDGEKLKEFKY